MGAREKEKEINQLIRENLHDVCSGSVVRDCVWESWALGSARTDLCSLALSDMQRIESHSGFDTSCATLQFV